MQKLEKQRFRYTLYAISPSPEVTNDAKVVKAKILVPTNSSQNGIAHKRTNAASA